MLYEIVPLGRLQICTMIRNSLQKYEIKKQLLSHDKAIPLHEQKHSILEQK